MLNKYVEIETTSGSQRRAKITGFTYRRLFLRGLEYKNSQVDLIKELELNNDPMDRVTLDEIAVIEQV
jgi:hypothetical protein